MKNYTSIFDLIKNDFLDDAILYYKSTPNLGVILREISQNPGLFNGHRNFSIGNRGYYDQPLMLLCFTLTQYRQRNKEITDIEKITTLIKLMIDSGDNPNHEISNRMGKYDTPITIIAKGITDPNACIEIMKTLIENGATIYHNTDILNDVLQFNPNPFIINFLLQCEVIISNDIKDVLEENINKKKEQLLQNKNHYTQFVKNNQTPNNVKNLQYNIERIALFDSIIKLINKKLQDINENHKRIQQIVSTIDFTVGID